MILYPQINSYFKEKYLLHNRMSTPMETPTEDKSSENKCKGTTERSTVPPRSGNSCHLCHTGFMEDALVFCFGYTDRGRCCRKKFCKKCLGRKFPDLLQQVEEHSLEKWKCPSCLDRCDCGVCRKCDHGASRKKCPSSLCPHNSNFIRTHVQRRQAIRAQVRATKASPYARPALPSVVKEAIVCELRQSLHLAPITGGLHVYSHKGVQMTNDIQRCRSCGTPSSTTAKFCCECGHKQTVGPNPPNSDNCMLPKKAVLLPVRKNSFSGEYSTPPLSPVRKAVAPHSFLTIPSATTCDIGSLPSSSLQSKQKQMPSATAGDTGSFPPSSLQPKQKQMAQQRRIVHIRNINTLAQNDTGRDVSQASNLHRPRPVRPTFLIRPAPKRILAKAAYCQNTRIPVFPPINHL
eukprot:gb/GEZN01008509.1/.p1 GENE.gb/GEZN01008509.1/~~gb/GEZN01008509.1/.p1  ORF type:complete len:405 (+),score=29.99 gb/GEZN01008509.1/:1-1215(+)